MCCITNSSVFALLQAHCLDFRGGWQSQAYPNVSHLYEAVTHQLLLDTGLVLHILLSFRWFFPFCCVCHRFAPSLLISNNYLIYSFLRRTPFTRIIFLNTAFSKALLNMAFSKTLVYIHVLV